MLGHVHDGGLVSRGRVVDLEPAARLERIDDPGRKPAGEALLAGGAHVLERESGVVPCRLVGTVPDSLVEAPEPAVEVVRTVVRGELVLDPFKAEPGLADSVPVPADQRPEVRARLEVSGVRIAGQIAEAENDVLLLARPIRRRPAGDDATVCRDRDLGTVVALQRVQAHGLAFEGAERRSADGRHLVAPVRGPLRTGPLQDIEVARGSASRTETRPMPPEMPLSGTSVLTPATSAVRAGRRRRLCRPVAKVLER